MFCNFFKNTFFIEHLWWLFLLFFRYIFSHCLANIILTKFSLDVSTQKAFTFFVAGSCAFLWSPNSSKCSFTVNPSVHVEKWPKLNFSETLKFDIVLVKSITEMHNQFGFYVHWGKFLKRNLKRWILNCSFSLFEKKHIKQWQNVSSFTPLLINLIASNTRRIFTSRIFATLQGKNVFLYFNFILPMIPNHRNLMILWKVIMKRYYVLLKKRSIW